MSSPAPARVKYITLSTVLPASGECQAWHIFQNEEGTYFSIPTLRFIPPVMPVYCFGETDTHTSFQFGGKANLRSAMASKLCFGTHGKYKGKFRKKANLDRLLKITASEQRNARKVEDLLQR